MGIILAATGNDRPSVVQIRVDRTLPHQIGMRIVEALKRFEAELKSGALIKVGQKSAHVAFAAKDVNRKLITTLGGCMDERLEKISVKRISWRRVAIALFFVFASLEVVYPAVLHVSVWYFARQTARNPLTAVMPQPLPITELADSSHGADTRALGYSLRMPWPIAKQTSAKTNVSWQFADGVSATAIGMSGDSMGPCLLINATTAQAELYKRMYGEKALSSKYEFLRAELNTSAADVSFWHVREHNAGVMSQLMLKPGTLLESKKLYSFVVGEMRGFQAGDPAQSRAVTVWTFDPSDRETWFVFRSGPQLHWTQAQINAVIASVRTTA